MEQNVLDHSHALFAEVFILRRDEQTVGDGYDCMTSTDSRAVATSYRMTALTGIQ